MTQAQTMARYNRWQNTSIYGAANTLSDAERRKDRGAFFKSIHGTLSHLLWGDHMWMSRFDAWPKPAGGLAESPSWFDDWQELSDARTAADARILEWSSGLSDGVLAGDITFYSGVVGREVTRNLGFCVTHFFNHQTHHRGQVHAMLTAAGAKTTDTDLFLMPENA